ncbi:hypothetical protein [Halobacteriaceae bacterium SHR40]|uniref:hypothetical protein n=1 Tax=Halovenus amylolytica TaxID=2500550 RepID=UPI000FE3AE93
MRVVSYVYDSKVLPTHVRETLTELSNCDDDPELIDVDGADSREDGRRNAMLTVKNAVRIGSTPGELFDDDGQPDFSVGALITEADTGRRTLHIGSDALDALRDDA